MFVIVVRVRTSRQIPRKNKVQVVQNVQPLRSVQVVPILRPVSDVPMVPINEYAQVAT